MKTAMQELIEFLDKDLKMHDFLQLPAYEKAKSLLEKERQQIETAYTEGYRQEFYDSSEETCKNYYDNTYNL